MKISVKQLKSILEVAELGAKLISATIEGLADDAEVDFDAVKITTSPEDALADAKARAETEG